MISLDIQPYCHKCPEFEMESTVIECYRDGPVRCRDIRIVCAHKERCMAIEDNIRERIQNDD